MKFTVFGSSGFIGSNVAEYLRLEGHEVVTPARDEMPLQSVHLGHVIYAIGLTGDFRRHPFETVNAHVTELTKRMLDASYDSWLYLSSTRVYGTSSEYVSEIDPVFVMPGANGIYDISKLLGESLCLALEQPTVRVVRLSNVYGERQSRHTFLGSLLEDVSARREILIREDPESSKDYIAITDVVHLIQKVALQGQHKIYNLASGSSTSHKMLAEELCQLTGLTAIFSETAPCRIFPRININRITDEFGLKPRSVLKDLSELITKSNAKLNRINYD
jgi:nucleoside-diphosphate-sugar epimerase